MLIVLALPSTEGAAVITGAGWGGGPATWARWSMARAYTKTLDGARVARCADHLDHAASRPLRAGRSGLHRRQPKQAPTSGVGPDGGLENEPHKNRAGRQATGT